MFVKHDLLRLVSAQIAKDIACSMSFNCNFANNQNRSTPTIITRLIFDTTQNDHVSNCLEHAGRIVDWSLPLQNGAA